MPLPTNLNEVLDTSAVDTQTEARTRPRKDSSPGFTSMLDPLPAEKNTGRRLSREWDASKVPPSQFQKRKGSIYSTPQSRDGHIHGADRDKAYHDKLKEKGWAGK